MSSLKTAAQILTDVKELIQDDRSMFRTDIERRDDGVYRSLYIGSRDKAARIKISEGSLKNFR